MTKGNKVRIRKKKSFLFDPSKWTRNFLYLEDHHNLEGQKEDKFCVVGQYLYKCGIPTEELDNHSSVLDLSHGYNKLQKIFSTEEQEKLMYIESLNDSSLDISKTIPLIQSEFKSIGITMKVKNNSSKGATV